MKVTVKGNGNMMFNMTWRALLVALVLGALPVALADEPESPYDRGAAGLYEAVKKLPTTARFLLVGAHPDDEPSGVVAYLARGEGVETAYLSLNRGEGGQNQIGPELFDGLGVIRTDELLGARTIDGAEQFFTTTYDFGYSRTLEETLEKWGEERALSDIVRVIRTFRPQVVVTFHADERVGHGHHQAAGYLTVKAFDLAADPEAFPEQLEEGLRPWQADKLYLSAGVGGGEGDIDPDSLAINAGDYDPVLGRTYQQIGLEGRSYHRSQGMGNVQEPGPTTNYFTLLESHVPEAEGAETSFFSNINTSITGIGQSLGEDAPAYLAADLEAIQTAATEAVDAFDPRAPEEVAGPVLEGLAATDALIEKVNGDALSEDAKAQLLFELDRTREDFNEAARDALGLNVRALSSDAVVVPGQTFEVTLEALNQGAQEVTVEALALEAPANWTVTEAEPEETEEGETPAKTAPAALAYNEEAAALYNVSVSEDAQLTRPYWRLPDAYTGHVVVEREDCVTLAYCPPQLYGVATVTADEAEVEVRLPVEYRWADPNYGERHRLLSVAPRVSLSVTPNELILPEAEASAGTAIDVQVTVKNDAPEASSGEVRLGAPEGWTVEPDAQPFTLEREEGTTLLTFSVTPPEGVTADRHEISATAMVDGSEYSEGYTLISYPHTEYRPLYSPAVATVNVLDVTVPENFRVGYVMGEGDSVADALTALGFEVEMLSPEQIANADLSVYDSIVLGVRAYLTRGDLIANHDRLMNYVEGGGNLVVQYNKYEWDGVMEGGPGPYPTAMSWNRVTEEDAPVTMLEPDNVLLNYPNDITQEDFEGWVQERGLYWLGEWDERYTPLLSSFDTGMEPFEGGLLTTEYGEGRWTYAGWAFFRELPAGVPGAYRLFTNLVVGGE